MNIEVEVLDEIQDQFFQALEAKTGWGKNDIKDIYKDTVLKILKQRIKDFES